MFAPERGIRIAVDVETLEGSADQLAGWFAFHIPPSDRMPAWLEMRQRAEIRCQPLRTRVLESRAFLEGQTHELEADRAWLVEAGLGRTVTDRPVAVPVLQGTLGLGPAETTRISSLQLSGGCLVEIDAYPAGAPRRDEPDGWPGGVAMLTLAVPALAAEAVSEAPYDGRRARVDRLPSGARIERLAA